MTRLADLAVRDAELQARAEANRAARLASGPTSCAHCGEGFANEDELALHQKYRTCKGLPGHAWETIATGNCYWKGRCNECQQTRTEDSSE